MGRIVAYLLAVLGFAFFTWFLLTANTTLGPLADRPSTGPDAVANRGGESLPIAAGTTGQPPATNVPIDSQLPAPPPITLQFSPAFADTQSGAIVVPIRVSGPASERVSIAVEFKTAASENWQPILLTADSPTLAGVKTRPSGTDREFVWDSVAQQVGHEIPAMVTLRARVRGESSKRETEWQPSTEFTVDNLPAPTVIAPRIEFTKIPAPEMAASGAVEIGFRLTGDPSDRFAVSLQFSVDGVEWADVAGVEGATLPTGNIASAEGIENVFAWDTAAQIANESAVPVWLRIKAVGAVTGATEWVPAGEFSVLNVPSPPPPVRAYPRIEFVTPLAEGTTFRGPAIFEFALFSDAESDDLYTVTAEFSTDGGATWMPLTLTANSPGLQDLAAGMDGTLNSLEWESTVDVPETAGAAAVWVRLSAAGAVLGKTCEIVSPQLVIDNTPRNEISAASITFDSIPAPGAMRRGDVEIDFTLTAPADDFYTVVVEFRVGEFGNWMTATAAASSENLVDLPGNERGQKYRYVWDSAAQAGAQGMDTVALRLRATNAQALPSAWAVTNDFVVDNSAPAVTAEIAFAQPLVDPLATEPMRGEITVPFTLRGPSDRLFDVAVEFSVDGENFQAATPAMSSPPMVGLSADEMGRPHSFVWDSSWQAGVAGPETVWLRISAKAGDDLLTASVISEPFTVSNAAEAPPATPPSIGEIVLPAGELAGEIVVGFSLVGSADDLFSVAAEYRVNWGEWMPLELAPLSAPLADLVANSAPAHSFTWDSKSAADTTFGAVTIHLRLRATGAATGTGEWKESAEFTVNNMESVPPMREPAAVAITQIPAADVVASGTVAIGFTVTAAEADEFTAEVEFSQDAGLTWAAATAADAMQTTFAVGAGEAVARAFDWDTAGLATAGEISVMVRVRATGSQTPASEWGISESFRISNAVDAPDPNRVEIVVVSAPQPEDASVAGDVTVRFRLVGANPDFYSLTAEFQIDGSDEWSAASAGSGAATVQLFASPEGIEYDFVWASASDAGKEAPQTVRLRLKATGDGGGETEWQVIGPFTVSNAPAEGPAEPVTVRIASILPNEPTVRGDVTVNFEVFGPPDQAFEAQIEFRVGEGAWTPAAPAASSPATTNLYASRFGSTHSFVWASAGQAGASGAETVQLRVRVMGTIDTSDWSAEVPVAVDNSAGEAPLPTYRVQIDAVPSVESSGNITIDYTLFGDPMESYNMEIQFSVDGGEWRTATIAVESPTVVSLISDAGGRPYQVIWASGSDAGFDGAQSVRIRIRGVGGFAEPTPWAESPAFTVNNSGN